MYNMNRNTGFTLLELIITVSIAAILIAVAVPSFSNIIKDNRLTSHINDFIVDANLARSEAMKSGTRVTMCPKNTAGTGCTTNWENGWIIFKDENANATVDGEEKAMRVHEALAGSSITLRSSGDTNEYLSFNSQGLAKTSSGATLTGEIILCDDRKDAYAKGILVGGGGTVSLRTPADITITCP